MDVRSQLTATQASANAFAGLNQARGSSDAVSRWGDALNRAMSSRANAAPAAGINGAMKSFAQFAAAHTSLNTRLGAAPGAAAINTLHAPSGPSDSPADHELEQKAQTVVSQFFMGSMLKQMRDSPFKSDMFSGGKAGDAYAGMFDTQISEHAGNHMARDLVKSMVKAYRKHSTAGSAQSGLTVHAAA